MVALTVFLKAEEGYAGCAGDCFTCHQNLIGNKEHKSLGTCIACHDNKKPSFKIIISNTNGGCGDRCFVCHINWPRNSYHAELDNCLKCHER